jgi:hypothetical protein
MIHVSLTNVKLSGLSTLRPSIVKVGVNELKLNASYDYLEVESNYLFKCFEHEARGL